MYLFLFLFYSPHENPVVLVLIAVVFTIYAVLLVFAYRADKHDHRKGGLVCLTDNSATDTQLYEIVTVTGLCQSSANTAKVSLLVDIVIEDKRSLWSIKSHILIDIILAPSQVVYIL